MHVTDAEIGALVRKRRHKQRLSQPELGAAIGVGEQQVQKYETGQSPLTVVRLVAAAAALGCRTIDLIPSAGRKP